MSDTISDQRSSGAVPGQQTGVLLSVVVPVYNQAESIASNVREIHARVRAGVDGPIEVIVVSDGSIDSTEERALDAAGPDVTVLHYDRNLGKGYAVKLGALTARGRWIAYVDADLDLDPSRLPSLLEVARDERLDIAIGSKRHPDSEVLYPRSRRVASWLYQQLVRVLFRLNVRDTQVGMKVLSREVVDDVVPLLLVKRYAFDLELLAVAASLGYGRIAELPIRLDYRFTGSGVRPLAVAHALVDTAAIFYRLRVLGYYGRKQELVTEQPSAAVELPSVTLVAGEDVDVGQAVLERLPPPTDRNGWRRVGESASGDVLALVEPGGSPAGNWLSAALSYLRRDEIAAVVTPSLARLSGSATERAGAAIRESRIGGGSQFFRFLPGNLRFVGEFDGRNLLVRREDYLALNADVTPDQICERLVSSGRRVLYTPETVVVTTAAALFRPHLRAVLAYGATRGRAVRRRGVQALRPTTLLPLVLVLLVVAGWPLELIGGVLGGAWLAILAVYAGVVLVAAAVAAARFRSFAVAALTVPGFVATHLAYAAGFVRGLTKASQ